MRSIILCPGRGSYSKAELGSIQSIQSSKLDIADNFRQELGRPTIRQMDASPSFKGSWHLAGENASILTAAISGADFDQIATQHNIVGICGNSMGWYTALGLSGALNYLDSLHLIETMGQYQKSNVIGGQLVYPLCNEEWQIMPEYLNEVERVLATIPDLYWSIKLGGQAILGGSKDALQAALSTLTPREMNGRSYPFILPMHSAFHTPLMTGTHRQALRDLSHLPIKTPNVPLIDGQGHIWLPKACSRNALLDYTLGKQVVDCYDFTAMIRATLKNFAPDTIILLGPGGNLGSAVAQVLIDEEWKGIRSKSDFLEMQKENPVVVAMARPEQRALVCND